MIEFEDALREVADLFALWWAHRQPHDFLGSFDPELQRRFDALSKEDQGRVCAHAWTVRRTLFFAVGHSLN